LRLLPPRRRVAGAFVVVAVLGAWCVRVALTRHVFELQALESRFTRAGRYAATTPQRTAFIAGQHTGSIRYHGDRPTLAWDGIPPAALDRIIEALARGGWTVSIALEDAEEPEFRLRFASQRAGRLDWPPSAEIVALTRVRIYDARGFSTGSARAASALPRWAAAATAWLPSAGPSSDAAHLLRLAVCGGRPFMARQEIAPRGVPLCSVTDDRVP